MALCSFSTHLCSRERELDARKAIEAVRILWIGRDRSGASPHRPSRARPARSVSRIRAPSARGSTRNAGVYGERVVACRYAVRAPPRSGTTRGRGRGRSSPVASGSIVVAVRANRQRGPRSSRRVPLRHPSRRGSRQGCRAVPTPRSAKRQTMSSRMNAAAAAEGSSHHARRPQVARERDADAHPRDPLDALRPRENEALP